MRHKGPSRESGGERRGPKHDCRLGRTQWGRTAMPKYCRAPNCSNISGRLGADNRPVRFYNWQVPTEPAQGHGIRDWLRHMGHEDWVPSCRQHLCSEHFTPSCFQWRRAVCSLQPDAVLSIFSPAPPSRRASLPTGGHAPIPRASCVAPGPLHLVVLGSASGGPEATTTVFLTPLPPAPAGPQPGVRAQHPLARLGTVLEALQRRVRRLQRRQEQPQGQLRAMEQLGQQVCKEGLPPRGIGACRAWLSRCSSTGFVFAASSSQPELQCACPWTLCVCLSASAAPIQSYFSMSFSLPTFIFMFLLPHLSALLSVSPFPHCSLHLHLSVSLISLSLSVFLFVWPTSISVSPCPPHFPLSPYFFIPPTNVSLASHLFPSPHKSLCPHLSVFPDIPLPPWPPYSSSFLPPSSLPSLLPSPLSPMFSISITSLSGTAQLPGPENPIICGGPDIAVVIAQSPAPPTLDAKPELLDTETPSA
ncbi:THAP domain-containing protein 8 [Mirounga leonina]|uniref:THAP domain-containing protein 8 n=1 Tax=Mirounga leonina TaxID=9715 RepID=UPI00156C40BF|nr:THAP domain-containing protein 8 [Mirounga leonina]